MSPEELKTRSRRIHDEVFCQGDLDLLDQLISPDIVHHVPPPQPGPGPEGVKDFVRMIRSAFSDLHVVSQNELAEGDKVLIHSTSSGTHTGEFMGVAPTGRRVEFDVVDINRFGSDGKIVEHWAVVDELGLMQQLGAVPAPPS
jgi:predicted ester cyclase